ncbi:MAG: glycosyltransferase [Bacteroidetes bacterium]|nr:glycosyltransferase [Bacteroidota bacterium]
MNETRLLIIGVIYNTYPETIRYIDSLAPLATDDFSLILVDNSDIEKPHDFLEKIKSHPFLHYIETGKNLGYFGGAREGLNYYLQKHSVYPQWILVTNVDIVFTPQFFYRLNELSDLKNLGVVAPSIISQKWNLDYNPKILLRYSKRKLQLFRFLYSNVIIQNMYLLAAYAKKWGLGLGREKKGVAEYPDRQRRKIYAPHGSCLVFKDAYFILGGTLDLPNFLFGEEIFVAETAARLGLEVVYDPRLVINDYEHASIGFFVTPAINKYYRESIRSILEHYYY